MFKNFSPALLGITGLQSEVIELALSYGFRGIDVDYTDLSAAARGSGVEHARRFIDSAKIKVGCCRLPFSLDIDRERFEQSLARFAEDARWLAEIGCTRALLTVKPYSDTRPYHENFEFHKNRLLEVAKALKSTAVRLGLNFNASPNARQGKAFEFIHAPDALEALLGMVPGTTIGIVVDPWQHKLAGAPLQKIKEIPVEKIVCVIASDMATPGPANTTPEENRALPGTTGAIDMLDILRSLDSRGYAGPVSPAAHKSRLRFQGREGIARAAGQAMIAVWPKAESLPPAFAPTPHDVAEDEVAVEDEVAKEAAATE